MSAWRHGLVGLAVLLCGIGAAGAQEGTPRIGVFDVDRLSAETNEGKRIQAELTAFRERKQTDLAGKEKEIQDLQGQLDAQALSLSAERRSALEKDIQRKMIDFNQAREAATREFQLELSGAQDRFQERLFGVVNEFARAEGFSLIFERSQVAFAAPAIDITTALVDAFNRMSPAAPPAAAQPAGGTPPPPKSPGGGSR